MGRLRTARLTDDTLVSQIDDFTGELEADLAAILGFEVDVDITASPFLINNAGQVTKDLVAWTTTGIPQGLVLDPPLALQITNATNGNVVAVGFFQIKQLDTSTFPVVGLFLPGASPFWVGGAGETGFDITKDPGPIGLAFIMNLSMGFDPGSPYNLPGAIEEQYWPLFGRLVTASYPGLVPVGGGNVSQYLCADGTFRFLGRPSQVCVLSYADNSALGDTVNSGTITVYWRTEDSDTNAMHAANGYYITTGEAGQYLVTAHVGFTPNVGSPGAGVGTLKIYRDRSGVITQWGQTDVTTNVNGPRHVQCEAMIDCLVGDKLYCTLGYTYAGGTQYSLYASHLAASRIA
jgi:hypothetical protein